MAAEEDIDVYAELKTDLMMFCDPFQAENVINWLNRVGLLDYDSLKDYYLEEFNDDGDS